MAEEPLYHIHLQMIRQAKFFFRFASSPIRAPGDIHILLATNKKVMFKKFRQ